MKITLFRIHNHYSMLSTQERKDHTFDFISRLLIQRITVLTNSKDDNDMDFGHVRERLLKVFKETVCQFGCVVLTFFLHFSSLFGDYMIS